MCVYVCVCVCVIQVTGFSDAEEIAVNKEKEVPFMLEERLKV